MSLFSRNFALLWQGQLVSQLGNQAFLVATTYVILEQTGSAARVGAVMMASTAPLAILGPLGGALADRYSRRTILVATDVSRAVAVGGLTLTFLVRPDFTTHHLTLLIAVAALNGAMNALFAPAVHAIIPDLVPGERLASANALNWSSIQTCALLGQAGGGMLYTTWGVTGLLLFDAVTFAYGGLASWLISEGPRPRQPRVTLRKTAQRHWRDTRDGFAYVRRRRGMTAVLAVFAGVNFLFMPVFVLLPFYARDVLGGGPETYGLLLASSGAGALMGAVISPRVRGRAPADRRLLRVCLLGLASSILVLAAARAVWVAGGAFVMIGAMSAVVNLTVVTHFQSTVPNELRGRVMALVIALSTIVVPVGMAAGGLMGDLWRASLPLVYAGCGLSIAALAVAGLPHRPETASDGASGTTVVH